LLDIVISEPYIDHEGWATGPKLYDEGVTAEQARTAHLARCARAKLAHRISTRARADSPLQHVRDTHHMDPEALAIKRQMVQAGREQVRREHAARRSAPARVQALRDGLRSLRNPEGNT
jgi:hypothetical protein